MCLTVLQFLMEEEAILTPYQLERCMTEFSRCHQIIDKLKINEYIYYAYLLEFILYELGYLPRQKGQDKMDCLQLQKDADNAKRQGMTKLWQLIRPYMINHRVAAQIMISKHWRGFLARRRLTRLKISIDIEMYPNLGVKFYQALVRFNALKK
jgi:hypothetical protein